MLQPHMLRMQLDTLFQVRDESEHSAISTSFQVKHQNEIE